MEIHLTPIFGNASRRAQCIKHFSAGGHHTLLIDGTRGIGKASFAGQLACWLLNGGKETGQQILPNPDQPSTRQIMNGSHPDFLSINSELFGRKSQQIPVEALEVIRHFTQRQGTAQRRVVLLDSLDNCVPVLSHGLLKLLEEPPERVVFLLIAHRLGQVLDTIRSRAQRISFQSLSKGEMCDCMPYLLLGENPPAVETLIALGGGAPGQAQILAEADLDGLISKLGDHLNARETNGSATRELVQYVCHKKYNHFAAWQHLCAWFMRAVLREKLLGYTENHPNITETALEPFRALASGDRVQNTFAETLSLLEKVQRPPAYLDAEQTVLSVILRWHDLIHKCPH
ncbi:MAG: hypothetical protein HRT36_01435 [Alphaproteobacteria bacterium]|nr:hypothetical protein [Alphaproteobacteria bacterium]